jgi:diaminopropionate ammonia-lyase
MSGEHLSELPDVEFVHNSSGLAPEAGYDCVADTALTAPGFELAFNEITQWPGYAATPLTALPSLAGRLGVGSLLYKDERLRFELKSFKALGGAYAVSRVLRARLAASDPPVVATLADLFSGRYADQTGRLTVTCATDGNHGRSVAWGAQRLGCACVIFVHETVSQARADAIAQYGAVVQRVAGNYDDAVRHAAEQATLNDWTVVSDTSYEGYRDIPVDVMHGYGVMAAEVVRALEEPPTHVFLQAGVGAMAASVTAAFWLAWGAKRPAVIVIEPENAACLLASSRAGRRVTVNGDLDTIMAGLACGEVSELAWPILQAGTQVFMTISDQHARVAMDLFANPAGNDSPIVSGETGASGLGALLAADADPVLASALGLSAQSRVLLIGSEGDTDEVIYQDIVGKSAAEVLR